MLWLLFAPLLVGLFWLIRRTPTFDGLPQSAPIAVETFKDANGNDISTTNLRQAQVERFSQIATVVGGIVAGTLTAAGVAAATAGPVGAALAGVIIAVGLLRGTAHLQANVWVQSVQNPFGDALGAIVDANALTIQNGSASRQSVTLALQAIDDLWRHYHVLANEFANQGADQATVIRQSFAELDPLVTQIQNDGRADLARLSS